MGAARGPVPGRLESSARHTGVAARATARAAGAAPRARNRSSWPSASTATALQGPGSTRERAGPARARAARPQRARPPAGPKAAAGERPEPRSGPRSPPARRPDQAHRRLSRARVPPARRTGERRAAGGRPVRRTRLQPLRGRGQPRVAPVRLGQAVATHGPDGVVADDADPHPGAAAVVVGCSAL